MDGLTYSLDRLLEFFDHPRPIIAQVHGHCLAGGCDLMMMCDLAVASDDAVFGQPEIRFGSTVVAQVMPWLIGARRAKELIMTGHDQLDAVEAHRIGLVNRVVPRQDLEAETMRLAGELAVVDPAVMTLTERAINRSWEAAGFRQALIEGVELGKSRRHGPPTARSSTVSQQRRASERPSSGVIAGSPTDGASAHGWGPVTSVSGTVVSVCVVSATDVEPYPSSSG